MSIICVGDYMGVISGLCRRLSRGYIGLMLGDYVGDNVGDREELCRSLCAVGDHIHIGIMLGMM